MTRRHTIAVLPAAICLSLTAAAARQRPVPLRSGEAAAASQAAAFKDSDPISEPTRIDTFRIVWETVRDKYFDPAFGGIDWTAVRERYEPKVPGATTSKPFHDLLNSMVHELSATHLAVLPPGSKAVLASGLMAPDTIVLRAGDAGILVFSVPQDSPAWRAGVRPGYTILSVGSTAIAPPDAQASSRARLAWLSEATRLLAGQPSSEVQVRVLDENSRERTLMLARTVPFRQRANIGRAEIRSFRVRPRIGLLWFDGWAVDLGAKLEPLLAGLADTDGLVIDLRQNRGGTNPGIDRLAKFLLAEPGVVAVSIPRVGERREWRHEGSGEAAYRGKVAVIVDEGSGSASELFAAFLQERRRAVIVGRTSYGGVLNSTELQLPSGGTLQYPHTDMTTPKGNRIEGHGVVPDVQVELKRADLLAGRDTVLERAIAAITR